MAKVLYDNAPKYATVVIILEPTEVGTMIEVMAAGVIGKKLAKSSKAYKLAMYLEGQFPS